MIVTPARFRADYPAFGNATTYPDAAISNWIGFAAMFLGPAWDDSIVGSDGRTLLDMGVELFVAHNLDLDLQAQQRANLGGPPGAQIGVMTAVSANGASVNYDTSVGINPDDGQWNLSAYGIRLVWLIRLVGMRPWQIGVGWPPFGITVGPAWPGPDPSPGVFG